MYSFVIQEFKRNQFIYHQGENAKMVYILYKGELEISRVKKSKESDNNDDSQIGMYKGFVIKKLGQMSQGGGNTKFGNRD